MNTPEQWINSVGEAVALDMFIGGGTKPGSRTEDVIKAIQDEAYVFGWRRGMLDAPQAVKDAWAEAPTRSEDAVINVAEEAVRKQSYRSDAEILASKKAAT